MLTLVQRLLCLTLLLALPASAQPRNGRVQGKVIDLESKEPLQGATVYLELNGEKYSPHGAVTDRQGQFHINNIPPGIYTLRCQSIGYHADSVRPVVVEGDSVRYFTIELDPYIGYTAEDARRDLDSGKVTLIFNAWPLYSKAQGELAKRYGFELSFTGCRPSDVDRYNHVVIDYLKKRNGENWYGEFEKEWAALHLLDSAQQWRLRGEDTSAVDTAEH